MQAHLKLEEQEPLILGALNRDEHKIDSGAFGTAFHAAEQEPR